MKQAPLYAMLREAGCIVLTFEDFPQFFGNWKAKFQRGHTTFEVVSDRREGWLALWRYDQSGRGERIQDVASSTFDEVRELEQLNAWLVSAP